MMKKVFRNCIFVLFLIITTFNGNSFTYAYYQAYEGERKDDSQVAYIKEKSEKFRLYRIDEVNKYNFLNGYDWLNEERKLVMKFDVAVLPGEHEFEIMRFGAPPKWRVVRFNLEAGKTYWVDEKKDELVIYVDSPKESNKIEFTSSEIPIYEEPTGSEVAYIKHKSGLKTKFSVLYHRIDGAIHKWESLFKSNPLCFNSLKNGSVDLKLTPGEHTIIYSVSSSFYMPLNSNTITANFEAGKAYDIEVDEIGELEEDSDIIYTYCHLVEVPLDN